MGRLDRGSTTLSQKIGVKLRFVRSAAGASVSLHCQLLRAAGFLRGRAASCPRAARVHAVYRGFALAVTTAYLLQECVYAYIERNDMDKLSKVLFLLLCHITSIAKQIVFYFDADRIDRVIRSLDEPLLNGARGAAALARTAAVARRWVRAYAGCAAFTCMLWLVFPVLSRLRGQLVEFPFWTGVDTQPPAMFTVTLLYSYYVTTLVAIANTTMDAFMATILYLCKTQLEILREDLESLLDRAKAESIKSGEDYDKILMSSFVQCFEHFRIVTDMVKSFQDIFGTVIFIQFVVGGWILCMAAYKLVSLSVLSIEFASMILFIVCILTEMFLYCFYGNELKVESEQMVTSAYAMRWVGAPVWLRRLLVLLMLRLGRPLKPSAAQLLPLSLETYIKILKSSYTFYAVLRQTK